MNDLEGPIVITTNFGNVKFTHHFEKATTRTMRGFLIVYHVVDDQPKEDWFALGSVLRVEVAKPGDRFY